MAEVTSRSVFTGGAVVVRMAHVRNGFIAVPFANCNHDAVLALVRSPAALRLFSDHPI